MESQGGHSIRVCVVVLDETLGTNVPDFNGLVIGSGGDAGAVGVEANCVNLCLVVCVGMNQVLLGDIPELDRLVIRA